ncbi:MAG: hypothetical protein JSW51_02160 [Gemmatimonadota bacterium]|nr:MAG: hypothetical protein JSW51_02160 [Gemmatimonadota bacterium]
MLENLIRVAEAFAILAAIGISVYTLGASKRKTAAEAADSESSAAERVTGAAVKLLQPMQNRIAHLESEVRELRLKVEQYIRDEVAYQAELHEKDTRIEALRQKLLDAREERDALRSRVEHLEDVCKRAGINGDD